MARWTLPVLIVAGQLLFWPGFPLLRGDPVPALAAAGATAACLLAGFALGFRRERPVPAFAGVLAGNVLAAVAAPTGRQWLETGDALLIISLTTVVALFSVAVRAPARQVLYAVLALIVWDSALAAVQDGIGADYPYLVGLAVVMHSVVAALGRRRARWNTERAAAARRLTSARQAEREAADAERRRLARELHDVTAHHLTSIVVNASAAEMLGDQRPDLRTEALDFAARTGRDTLDALRRLVAIMPAAPAPAEEPALTDLAEGFRALGQRITLDIPSAGPPISAAVYGIVREALTNTLRYAPGGRVTVRYTEAELLVEDDGGGAPVAGAGDSGSAAGPGGAPAAGRGGGVPMVGLGGGRGLGGMRERAQSAGGVFEAGPRDGGGWRVRVTFPDAAVPHAAKPGLRSRTVIDGVIAAALMAVQLLGISLAVEEGLSPAATVLVLLAHAAHTAPILLRRRAPWWALLATALTGLLGPLLVLTGVVPAGLAYVFVFGCVAELAMVHAVGSRGAQPAVTWLAVPAAAGSWALTMAVMIAADMADDPEFGDDRAVLLPATVVLLTPILAILLAVPAAACWGTGLAARRRRDRRQQREEGGVAAALHQAALHARAERLRIAAGLHEEVLRHAADVPGAADRGDLPGVLGAARQALTAMRSLLDGLTPSRGPAGSGPAHEPAGPGASVGGPLPESVGSGPSGASGGGSLPESVGPGPSGGSGGGPLHESAGPGASGGSGGGPLHESAGPGASGGSGGGPLHDSMGPGPSGGSGGGSLTGSGAPDPGRDSGGPGPSRVEEVSSSASE